MSWLDPQNPAFQSAVAPFLVSLLLVGLIWFASGRDRGSAMAVCGVAIAILTAYWLTFSVPPFPARAASQKLGYLIAGATLLSLLIANLRRAPILWQTTSIVAVLSGLAWIAQSKIRQQQYGVVLALATGAMIFLVALLACRKLPVESGVSVMVAGFALAGIAFLAPSASITQMALAIAVSMAGFLLWTWPKPRLGFAEAGVVAIAAPLIWLGGQTALYTKASDMALGVAAFIPIAPMIRQKFVAGKSPRSSALAPIITGIISGAIATVAIAIAYMSRTGTTSY